MDLANVEYFDLADWLDFETPTRLEHVFDCKQFIPSLTTGSRQNTETTESSTFETTRSGTVSNTETAPVKWVWMEEGELLAKKQPRRRISRRSEDIVHSSISPLPSPVSAAPSDSHSEMSCFKCRLTEVEARRCKVERRREQNKVSQRKFRARKEAKIRDATHQVATLEVYIEFLEKQNEELEATNARISQQLEDSKKRSPSVVGSPLLVDR